MPAHSFDPSSRNLRDKTPIHHLPITDLGELGMLGEKPRPLLLLYLCTITLSLSFYLVTLIETWIITAVGTPSTLNPKP